MKKNYDITIYESRPDEQARFALGTSGVNPLIAIGLNPSYADKVRPDRTVSKIIGYADRANPKFDSFIMLNLYPQRATDTAEIHQILDKELLKENVIHIVRTLMINKNASVLAAWGETIYVRPFFIECLKEIYEATKNLEIHWLKIGLTQSGHPLHPSRAPYIGLTDFDIERYLMIL